MKTNIVKLAELKTGERIIYIGNRDTLLKIFSIFLFSFMFNTHIKSQGFTYIPDEYMEPIEEFPVIITVSGYGSFTTDALYFTKENLVYVSVRDLFNFFKIQCMVSDDGNILSGSIEYESKEYTIDLSNNKVIVQNRSYYPGDRLMKYMGDAFMESSLFKSYFGIQLDFNFRTLTINVKSDFELPIVRQMKLEKMRKNLNRMRGHIVADTTIDRRAHLARFGHVDWDIYSSQTVGGTTNNRMGLGVGGELLYGEASAEIRHYTDIPFESSNLNYLWRWVDNSKSFVKQFHLGKIQQGSIASIFKPVIGYNLTNTPTGIRKAEGYYTITDYTEPNWTVELYIGSNLIDYTTADASGFFTFQVPVVYGFNVLELRFYGPMGEERTVQKNINIPYAFTPAGKLEYNVKGGIIEDKSQAMFSHNEISYGLSRKVSIGAGVEYLSSISNGKYIPFISASFLPLSRMMIKTEYAHGVRTSGMLDYYFFRNTLLEASHTQYVKGQQAIRFRELSDSRFVLSTPYRLGAISGFTRISFRNKNFENFNFSIGDVSLSAHYRNFNVNLLTGVNWIADFDPYSYSNLALTYRMRKGLVARSNIQYNYNVKSITALRFELEKRFSRAAYVSLAYENYTNISYNGINLTFRYNLPFARTHFRNSFSNLDIITSQGAHGSLSFGSGNNHIYAGDHASLRRSGISVIPFLDINHNGIKDADEPYVEHLPVRIRGGRVVINRRDSTTRIVGLEPFTSYMLEIDDSNLPDISWRIENKNIEVVTDPNQFKKIYIPVKPMGEVSGYVKDSKTNKGIGRILLNINDLNGNEIAKILTESDGFFTYMDLAPGTYTISIDSNQLNNLNFSTDINQRLFEIKASAEGTIHYVPDYIVETTLAEYTEISEKTDSIEEKAQKPIEVERIHEAALEDIKEKISTARLVREEIKKEYMQTLNEYINNLNKYFDKLEEYLDLLMNTTE